jgi:Kef-type K+ transport system membrane component KefB/voltage-gated potassium channel Kch
MELGIVIIIATIVAYIVHRLRQPIIIGYMITGVIIGPVVFNLVASEDMFSAFAKIGISFLLFMVGLSLNVKHIQKVGKVATLTGIGQVLFTSVIGYFICRGLGFPHMTSIYIGIALTFSSTIIVIKLLSDKEDLDKLYGRIVVGILVIQDLVAIFLLMFMSSYGKSWEFFGKSFIFGIGAIALVYLVARYVFPKLLPSIAKSQELLFLFSLGWCFVLSIGFSLFNFSIEIGALLAGISLASTPFAAQINSKVRSIRDFFILMFFISLISHVTFSDLGIVIKPAIILSLFVLLGSPIVVLLVMGFLGFSKRNSFLSGITIAQISEFSLIVIMMGVSKGLIEGKILSMITLVSIFTMFGSTYWIMYGSKMYQHVAPFLKLFERKELIDKLNYHDKKMEYKIYLFGYNRTGYSILRSLRRLKKSYLVIDHNPDTVITLAKEGIHCKYGDAEDIELLAELDPSKVEMVISTIPDFDTNMLIIDKIRETNKRAIIIITAHHLADALKFYEKGADYVILPHYISGDHASTIIENFGTNFNKFLEYKIHHIKDLRKKRHLKHHVIMGEQDFI